MQRINPILPETVFFALVKENLFPSGVIIVRKTA